MKKYSKCSLLAAITTLLLSSTSSFGMLKRLYKERAEKRAQDLADKIFEADASIQAKQDKAYNDCVEQLALTTKQPFHIVKARMDGEREWIKEHLKHSNPNAVHDHTIPDSLYKNIVTSLREEGINPHSVTLKHNQDPNWKGLAGARTTIVLLDCELNQDLLVDERLYALTKHLILPRIELSEELSSKYKDNQKFILKHEIYHELSRHHTMDHIRYFTDRYADASKLRSTFEIEADIRAASTSREVACEGAHWQCKYGHRAILDNQTHCEEMKEICELMTYKEKLQRDILEELS